VTVSGTTPCHSGILDIAGIGGAPGLARASHANFAGTRPRSLGCVAGSSSTTNIRSQEPARWRRRWRPPPRRSRSRAGGDRHAGMPPIVRRAHPGTDRNRAVGPVGGANDGTPPGNDVAARAARDITAPHSGAARADIATASNRRASRPGHGTTPEAAPCAHRATATEPAAKLNLLDQARCIVLQARQNGNDG